jgi:hypothetical protein
MSIPGQSENGVKKLCMDWLKLWGAFPIRVNSAAVVIPAEGDHRRRFYRANSEPGCSDCLVVLPGGRFGAFEFKQPGAEPSDIQTTFLDQVRRRGGLALVVSSLDQLRQDLAAAGYVT